MNVKVLVCVYLKSKLIFLVILKTQKMNVKLYPGKYGIFLKNVFSLRNSLNTALL